MASNNLLRESFTYKIDSFKESELSSNTANTPITKYERRGRIGTANLQQMGITLLWEPGGNDLKREA